MKAQDKKAIRVIFNEGIQQLVLPILDDIYKNMATKKDLEQIGDVIDKRFVPLTDEVSLLRHEVMGVKSDVLTMNNRLIRVESKVNKIWETENEDIQAVNVMVVKHDRKIVNLDQRVKNLET